ncbi:hypothetical protein BSZ39_06330 [Bowdeniella nasicola]|uniref:Acyl-CoA carboxylase epsilon subunit n=1 Tax=Bowdeniella nasicola TaxID=208480 RepID=A0A1Q5Q2V1_9ACTO|nr:acyl-CoA carboxylase epsilon subunit [Bowdeniella nasicola]OKL54019.1 hypothetical protein BSZ39_06330 [Bowdeniella nasicola]
MTPERRAKAGTWQPGADPVDDTRLPDVAFGEPDPGEDDEQPSVRVVAGSPDSDELAALIAGLTGVFAANGHHESPPEPAALGAADCEWNRRARPGARTFAAFSGGDDCWRWRDR